MTECESEETGTEILTCPNCGLDNVLNRRLCDCGYDFQWEPGAESDKTDRISLRWLALYLAAGTLVPCISMALAESTWKLLFIPLFWPVPALAAILVLPLGIVGLLNELHMTNVWVGLASIVASYAVYLLLLVRGIRKRSWVLLVLWLLMQAVLCHGLYAYSMADYDDC